MTLETFGPQHGLKMLATHMEPTFAKHRLPTNIYPFTEEDVAASVQQGHLPPHVHPGGPHAFEAWLDEDPLARSPKTEVPQVVTREAVDGLIRTTIEQFERGHLDTYDSGDPDRAGLLRAHPEHRRDPVGPLRREGRLRSGGERGEGHAPERDRAAAGKDEAVCLCVNNAEGNSFTAKMRNLIDVMRSGKGPKRVVLLRDRRCKAVGDKGQEYVETFQEMGGVYLPAGGGEVSLLNAIYDTLVAIEEHDLSIGKHEIDKRQFVEFLKRRTAWAAGPSCSVAPPASPGLR